uniref:Replication factor C subunit 3 n=1 Tax=Cajanus cajan TaxID=3821 RepID=A0A151SFG0_CAJCA|nr:Replication factor C subunit 3 [Cajanus cajan]
MSGADVIEEKPLRERVSETSDEVEMDVWKVEELKEHEKEKALFVSEPTVVASESQCKEGGNAYEYTWATKYQPTTLEEFICNKDKALQLKAMVKEGCGCSHFIFEGPPCVGKRSMIRAMLREVFGADKVQVNHFRHICNVIKLQRYTLILALINAKVVVFLILTDQSLVEILEYIGKEEGIKLSRDLVHKIILRSKNNLRQAIRSLEASCRNKDALKDDDLILTGWEEDILNIAQEIIQEQSPRQLYVIRGKLQSLMIHDVPPDFIYKVRNYLCTYICI